MQKHRSIDARKLILMLCCLAINLAGAHLALTTGLPLFLDSIGTVLAAAMGGYLAGIIVGFCTNIINSFGDPITLYYGILSVIIACLAAYASYRRAFRNIGKTLLAGLSFALVGGALGSLLTWLLYGFRFGEGISAPLAHMLHDRAGFTEFFAQLSADMLIDLADKLITVIIVYTLFRVLPRRFVHKFPLGANCKSDDGITPPPLGTRRSYRKLSLRHHVVRLIIISVLILGTLATSISYLLYKNAAEEKYAGMASGVTALMIRSVDADAIDGYLESGVEDEAYAESERRLKEICDSMTDIEYMYIYQIRPDGCHVVFDVDTPELAGETLGTVLEPDNAFSKCWDQLLAGEPIEPVVSNETYGWLLTVYTPIYNTKGKCVAYAAADVAMSDVISDRYVFIVKMVSLLFSAAILIVMAAITFAEERLVWPINAMAEVSDRFAYESEEKRLTSTAEVQRLDIDTGDEIENLYHALSKTVTDVAAYITDINQKNGLITRMQDNIILSFANMVEARDACTGSHIKHTSGYVRAIGEELLRQGAYPETLTEAYLHDLARSAPLHDIGKIKVPDAILNKPGKLTPDEFAVMKTHTTAGRVILSEAIVGFDDAGYLTMAIDMSAYHHERWDGGGYPEAKNGEDIPLCARIMAVADVFDALISMRSYKKSMPMDEARDVIAAESGTHFDPVVVEAFLSAWDSIVELSR